MNKLLKASFFFCYLWILFMAFTLFCDFQDEDQVWDSIPTVQR